ncbi:transcription termination factor MTERF6, chloroplastic/mitochondrial-like [Morus notabilis]|uniref:transcription termination factor MTERF6, chloroplastic/mitochondrial-like n=1 Tax=Morus notabilis TaxID=981085 RepID=UPI000CED77FC|nr:transcription termination factor MTERF6, chloroplastic/mitochondrial-like [Morus notabilis]
MSQFLLKTILSGCRAVRTSSPTSNQGSLRDPNVVLLRWMSSSSNQQSFTVSYLVSSLGYSSQTALSVSKYVNFDTPDKADKVIKSFKDYGFTDTQISRLVRTYPTVLLFNAERKILPTLQFFESKGISGPEIAKMVTAFPTVLGSSLANRILPSYDYMRNLIQSDDKPIIAVKNYPDVLVHNVEKYVSPNVDILREHGASESNIATIMRHWPRSFIVTPYSFRKVVEKVVEMGFDASKVNFVIAVKVSRSLSESTWERKVDAYKKWGWSDEDVLNAFKRNPLVHVAI